MALSSYQASLSKIQRYCAFQERCSLDVMLKLRSWKVSEFDIKRILVDLYRDNFINDIRFVQAYVIGKFRHNKWGKIKIAHELFVRGFSQTLIQESLASISEDEYRAMAVHLIAKKKQELFSEKDEMVKKNKIIAYLVGKGYEYECVNKCFIV